MAVMNKHHQELDENGVGKCSVPMWCMGVPAGFCDEPSYGKPTECATFRDAYTGEIKRMDGRYSGYVPGLACPGHGGPDKPIEKCKGIDLGDGNFSGCSGTGGDCPTCGK